MSLEKFNFNKKEGFSPKKKVKKRGFSNFKRAVLISAGLISASPTFASGMEQNNKPKEKAPTELLNRISQYYQKVLENNESTLGYFKKDGNLSADKLELVEKEYKLSEAKAKEIVANPESHYEKIIQEVKNCKQELINHFASKEFFEKVKKDMKLDDKKTHEKQENLINNLNTVKLVIASPDSISSLPNSYGLTGAASYSEELHRVVIPFSEVDWEEITHEFIHAAYRSIKELTPDEEKILYHNYKKEKGVSKETNKYLRNPAERIVRKTLLDLDLERWNIKKYNEKFTHEHYLKLLELKKRNQLDGAALDLLNTTTEKQLEKIMNTIAYNDAVKDTINRNINNSNLA